MPTTEHIGVIQVDKDREGWEESAQNRRERYVICPGLHSRVGVGVGSVEDATVEALGGGKSKRLPSM